MDYNRSLQDQFAPNLICFGCGPANPDGLQIKSYVEGDRLVARFTPQPKHRAYQGMINGGIIGTLLDCHMNWAAAYHLMVRREAAIPPCCVTARYEVIFEQPTPDETELIVSAWIVESSDRKGVVEATVGPEGVVTARGNGTFVAVKEGHPAFHRWG